MIKFNFSKNLFSKIKAIFSKSEFPETPNAIDRLQERTILRFIPYWIKPNHLTLFRYFSIPFILFLLLYEYYSPALILFVISVYTDALDGAMARTRKQITDWGKINDPMADKALIALAGAFLITRHISFGMLLAIIAVELIIISSAVYRNYGKTKVPSAKLAGKIKMVFQSSALILLLLFSVFSLSIILIIAQAFLYLAIFLGLTSAFVYGSL